MSATSTQHNWSSLLMHSLFQKYCNTWTHTFFKWQHDWLPSFTTDWINGCLKKSWQNTHCFTGHHVAAWIYSKLRLLQNQDLSWQNKDLENFWLIWFGSSIVLFCDAEQQAKYAGLSICYLPRIFRGEKEFSQYHHFFFQTLNSAVHLAQLWYSVWLSTAAFLCTANVLLSCNELPLCVHMLLPVHEEWQVLV